jgi:hypothetical protein
MDDGSVRDVARLLRERNAIDEKIARITGRPVASGHLGEWVASQIFDIRLEESASAPGIDGRFRAGPLQGRTVNVKWYMKHQGLLDSSESAVLDYYLVLAGPPSPAGSSRGTTRPWCIESVYLFDARQLRSEQEARGVKRGVASSVTRQQWLAAQIYPIAHNRVLPVASSQAALLQLFSPADSVARATGLCRVTRAALRPGRRDCCPRPARHDRGAATVKDGRIRAWQDASRPQFAGRSPQGTS